MYWIAKPRVGMTEITGLGDVQRFYMVLSPGGDRADAPNRLVIIGGLECAEIDRAECMLLLSCTAASTCTES